MQEVMRCREMASICRQRSTLYHDEKWAWLAKAHMWDDLADQYSERHYTIEEDIRIVPADGPSEDPHESASTSELAPLTSQPKE